MQTNGVVSNLNLGYNELHDEDFHMRCHIGECLLIHMQVVNSQVNRTLSSISLENNHLYEEGHSR